MKVLLAGQNYRIIGGSDRYMLNLEQLLLESGAEVIPFAASHPDNIESPYSDYFVEETSFESPSLKDIASFIYSWDARNKVKKIISERDIQIAHLNIYYGKLTASIISPLVEAGIPIIQTLHEYKIVCPVYTLVSHGVICEACADGKVWNAVVKKCNRGSVARSSLVAFESWFSARLGAVDKISKFIAVSDFQKEKVIQLGVPREKVVTIHNFIDASQYRAESAPGRYILYFGRIEKIKGIYTLLEAARQAPHVEVKFVGHGQELASLREAASELTNVEVLGFHRDDQLKEMIRNSICTVVPSEWFETFGLTILESFACGRPVICSKMGGMPEIVSEGVDGLTFEAGDALSLSACIDWMFQHPRQACEMGAAGRMKVETIFTREAHFDKVMSLYKEIAVSVD